jgi:phage terminase large subunit GpA-like protein
VSTAAAVPQHIRTLWAPPPVLPPSAWAEKYRRLPESSSARGALWDNSVQPALAGIMDAVDEPGVREIALMKAAQAGGSESLANILGFLIHLKPCPILLVHPTYDGVIEWTKETFDDLVRATPELGGRVRDRRAPRGEHQGESTIAHKRFPGGYLAAVGGNSPNAYARRSCRVVIADDASRLPPAVGEEGDPATLLRQRGATWPDSLCIFVSTPTIEDDVIHRAWQRSDQRRYMLTCPSCGGLDYVTWGDPKHYRVVYERDDTSTARLDCPACRAKHDEPARREMVATGRWMPTAVPAEPGHVGFHLPRTISLLGDSTLQTLVAAWLGAKKGGREALRVFVNTTLGEPWEDRDAPKLEPHALLSRREHYENVPAAAAILTAGVDVQANRLEMQVVAWGLNLERWVMDWRSIDGDPRLRETWARLADALRTLYEHETGRQLPIAATCVDSGYLADEVYLFALEQRGRNVFASKGESHGRGAPVWMAESNSTARAKGVQVPLQRLNVDLAKYELHDLLQQRSRGEGRLHLPESVGEDYLVQLTGEHLERFYVKGVAHERWVKDPGARNEAWDTLIYARAAFDRLCTRRNDAWVRAVLNSFVGNVTPPEPGGREKPPEGAPPVQPQQRSQQVRQPRTRSWSGGR